MENAFQLCLMLKLQKQFELTPPVLRYFPFNIGTRKYVNITLPANVCSKQIAMWNNILSELILILSTYYWQSAAAVLGKDLEKPKSDVTPVHRIRITLTSTNVRSLEKVCADLISRAKKLSLPVKVSFYFAALSLLWWFSNESTNAQTNL